MEGEAGTFRAFRNRSFCEPTEELDVIEIFPGSSGFCLGIASILMVAGALAI